uniref:Uncharacterized protein n=1 Tax=Anguilla anguilla TaxID=7936 RepID=A0A0E9TM83_ANGAN
MQKYGGLEETGVLGLCACVLA